MSILMLMAYGNENIQAQWPANGVIWRLGYRLLIISMVMALAHLNHLTLKEKANEAVAEK